MSLPKKTKVTASDRPLINQLPNELLAVVISFCNEPDLFYTVPLICKKFYKYLKTPTLSENQIEEKIMLKLPITGSYECDSSLRTPISYAEYIKSLTAVEENKIWKQRCLSVVPSLKLITNDHLYCYKSLYATKLLGQGFERPEHWQLLLARTFLQPHFEKMVKNQQYLLSAMSGYTEATEQKQERTIAIGHLWKKLAGNFEAMAQEMNARVPPFHPSKTKVHSIRWKPIVSTELRADQLSQIEFIRNTMRVEQTSSRIDDFHTIVSQGTLKLLLLSPVNGNWVSFLVKMERQQDKYDPEDFVEEACTGLEINFFNQRRTKGKQHFQHNVARRERGMKTLEAQITVDPITRHLGLDTEPNTMAKCLWEEVIMKACRKSLGVFAHRVLQGIQGYFI